MSRGRCTPFSPLIPARLGPRQYVALTFYMELLNADLPELADILAFDHNKCMFDGAHGEELSWVSNVVPRGREYVGCK